MPTHPQVYDIIAITGHRDYPDRSALYRGLDELQAREYVFGGARGVDTDALEYIGQTQPGSHRTVVVPNRVIDQPMDTRAITKHYATEVIELKNSGPDRYQIRNQYMVDRADYTRAFYDQRGHGGTFNTIEYMKAHGKNYSIQPMNEYDPDFLNDLNEQQLRDQLEIMQEEKINLSAIKGAVLNYFWSKGLTVSPVIVNIMQNW